MSAKLALRHRSANQKSAEDTAQELPAARLLDWYERHARVLPWRVGPRERRLGVRPEPYRVWLSEVMLQQTTVKAVAPYFARFLSRWPDVRALAAADERDVMAAWAGLGYYARARSLIACARVIAGRRDARFPSTAAELVRLPGIGPYTSAAIAAIAFDEPVAVVDGNVERVIARVFAIETPMPAGKAFVRGKLAQLIPAERPGEFAEALMDLGATICTPRKPACAICPWTDNCRARIEGRQAEFPLQTLKAARPVRFGIAHVARRADGAILLRRRPPRGLLGGMCEVPGSEWGERQADAVAPIPADWLELALTVEHVFTHFALKLAIRRAEFGLDAPAPSGCWWAPPDTLAREALPSVMKKAIEVAYPGSTKPSAGKK